MLIDYFETEINSKNKHLERNKVKYFKINYICLLIELEHL